MEKFHPGSTAIFLKVSKLVGQGSPSSLRPKRREFLLKMGSFEDGGNCAQSHLGTFHMVS